MQLRKLLQTRVASIVRSRDACVSCLWRFASSRMPVARIPVAVVLLGMAFASDVRHSRGADELAPTSTDNLEAAGEEAEAVRPTLDLGDFKIHDLRPTRNLTAKVTFSMHLALSQTLSPEQVAQLDRWQHRLRDQVIIATRTLEVKEFEEVDLSRLRRKILIRVNRLFRTKLAEEVLLTKYLFRTS